MSPGNTKIKIAPCADEDIPICFKVVSQSFGHNAPFVDIYFPAHDTTSGQVQGAKRLLAWKSSSEGVSFFLKAVARGDPGNPEQIIGIGVWTHMKEPPPSQLDQVEDVKEVWPNEDDREYMTRLWADYVKPRSQVIKDSNGAGVYVLELLAVHPDFHRQGAGTALVKWGTEKADEHGIEAVVEGTPIGRKTYENGGFRAVIEEMSFNTGEKFETRKKPVLVFMKKAAKT